MSDFEVDLSSEEREVFLNESRDQIDEAEQILLEMEAAGGRFGRREDDAEKLATLFRVMHTLKGNAASIGLSGIESLSHTAEDIMDGVRRGEIEITEDLADVLLRTIDELRHMLAEFAEKSVILKPSAELLEELCSHNSETVKKSAEEFDYEDLFLELDTDAIDADDLLVQIEAEVAEDADLPVVRAMQCILACEEVAKSVVSRPKKESVEAGEVEGVADLKCLLVAEDGLDGLEERIEDISGIENIRVSVRDDISSKDMPRTDKSDADTRSKRYADAMTKQIRVDVSVLDRLMNLSGEMVINRNRLSSLVREMEVQDKNGFLEEIQQTVEAMGRATMDLQEDIMEIRLLPLDELFRRFPRMMRNLRKSSDKRFHFTVEGGATEIDRSLMEVIADPLTHLLRNAVDHGIEKPEVRTASGKNPEGEIRLSAHRNENNIIVEVSDDGGGIDPEALREKAEEKGLLSHSGESITEDDLVDVMFSSGFSTSDEVTEISGRGVGLDVVKKNIESVNGSISVENAVGEGTTFRIALPLTVTTVKSLLVGIENGVYVLPLSSVAETLAGSDVQFKKAEGRFLFHYRDNFIPILHLSDCFEDIERSDVDIDDQFVVVLQAERGNLGLLVDELHGEEDCVIKPLGRPVDNISGISSATILPDGRVALILDAAGLYSEMRSVERSV